MLTGADAASRTSATVASCMLQAPSGGGTASRVASEMAELAGVGDRVEFLTGSSTDVIDELDEAFDVVLLDHWKGLYQRDMERILERGLLRPGAMVIADNLGPVFGDNPYLPWMKERGDFDSHYVESHLEYQAIEDGVLHATVAQQPYFIGYESVKVLQEIMEDGKDYEQAEIPVVVELPPRRQLPQPAPNRCRQRLRNRMAVHHPQKRRNQKTRPRPPS